MLSPLAVYGASRIGKPDSPWARRLYGERRPKKQAKAEHRFRPDRRTEQLKERFRDTVGGVTEAEYQRGWEKRGSDPREKRGQTPGRESGVRALALTGFDAVGLSAAVA